MMSTCRGGYHSCAAGRGARGCWAGLLCAHGMPKQLQGSLKQSKVNMLGENSKALSEPGLAFNLLKDQLKAACLQVRCTAV